MTRLDLFKQLPPKAMAVEVGTLQGDFADEIESARHDIHLICVDYWPKQFASYKEKWLARKLNALLIEKPSVEAGNDLALHADWKADLVYIDAMHDYTSVYEDLEAWWPVVKQGGILSGHDFESKPDDGFWGPIEVQEAVLAWAKKHGLKVNVTDEHNAPSWWVVKP